MMTVIGPIPAADWHTMLMLRRDIKWLDDKIARSNNVARKKFLLARKKEQDLYKTIRRTYTSAAAEEDGYLELA